MRRRRFPWILLPLPLLSLLTACTPPDEPLVGLAVRDGHPVGVLVHCGGMFAGLSVRQEYPDDGTDHPDFRWRVGGQPTSDVVEVALLGQPPDGWTVDEATDYSGALGRVVDVEPLTEFRPGVTYSVGGLGIISVDFTLEDLRRIGADQVLAPSGRESTKVMSRKTFLRKARDGC
ncbi:hypothetical protein [Micromonospora sp. DT231]|uniref:hypothetical protein n=1 Tax=Micromonospora sp. DT231 TaxID=3416526 RepID=UPI003CFA5A22